ncbi:4-hydroxybenzoate octaprenyltransferase [Gammaproteobacteria bacterium]|nr:4-hydroxybenzoate octaprenyltransferase [Gammaproteobacteria bacterium]|tara:strand:+ start:326 stop:1186 length:861 start_codon:yes stop_codon:yes gene_type:complete
MKMINKIQGFIELTRLDKPVGIYLLFWPSFIGLLLGAIDRGSIEFKNYFILIIGTVLVRSCGCIINDINDYKFDRLVSRTKNRPLASGKMGMTEAWLYFILLATLSLCLLFFVPLYTIYASLVVAVFIMIYPLTKRFLKAPQFFLGITFGSGTIIAFSLVSSDFSLSLLILFIGTVLWIISFDTIYAFEDIADDLKIGINSTPILWGDQALNISKYLHLAFYVSLAMIGFINKFSLFFLLVLIILLGLYIHQRRLINNDQYLDAFKFNNWIGMFASIGFVIEAFLI